LLTGAIAAKPTISIQLSTGGDNVTNARDAAGNVTVNLDRNVSSTDIYPPLRGYNGEKIPNPFNIIAGHEVLGHAYPKLWAGRATNKRLVRSRTYSGARKVFPFVTPTPTNEARREL